MCPLFLLLKVMLHKTLDINDGGLKMLDIHSMICAQRVRVLKKKKNVEEEKHSSWKITLDYFLSEVGVGDKFILHCNFDTRKLLIYVPAL